MATSDNKIICPKCNSELPQDSGFCQYCGSKIENSSTTIDNTVEENNAPATEKVVMTESETVAKILASGIVEGQKAMEANKESQPHNELDADFGLVPQKPIYTVAIDEQEKYLKSLRTINGEPIKWNRRGSMSVDGVKGMVDVYDTYLPSGEEYKTLYINMYGAYNSTFAPKGFAFAAFNDVRVNTSPTKSSKKKCFLISTPFLWILFVASLLTLALVIATAVGQNINYDESQDAWNHHQATLTDKTVGCGSYGCDYCRGLKTVYSYNEYGYPDFRDLFSFYAENDDAYSTLVTLFDISVLLSIVFSLSTVTLFIVRHRLKTKKILSNIFRRKNVALIIVSLVMVASLVANGILAYTAADYKRVYEFHRNKANELKVENDQYYEYWVSTFEQIDFFDRFVVFVEDDGTNKYHKYECSKFKGDSFWAFNIDAAKDEGYTACPYCH